MIFCAGYGVGDDGSAGFDQWRGRKGRREKNSNKIAEGKYQSLPIEKLKLNDRLHGEGSSDVSKFYYCAIFLGVLCNIYCFYHL